MQIPPSPGLASFFENFKHRQYKLFFIFTCLVKTLGNHMCSLWIFTTDKYCIIRKSSKCGIYVTRCKPLRFRHLPILFIAHGQKQADSNSFPPEVHVLSNESQLKLCPSLSSGCKWNMLSQKLSLERVHGLATQAWTPGGGGKPDCLAGKKGHLTKRD